MYCAACGSLLPNEAQFCPRCGKRKVQVGVATDAAPSGKLLQTEPVTDEKSNMLEPQPEERSEDRPTAETGTITDGTAPAISPEGSEPRQFVWESLEPESTTPTASGAPVTVKAKSHARYANAGSITLGAVAFICLVLGAVQGFIPIFLIEGAAFGGLSWLCAAKWPLSRAVHSMVFVASLLLAGLVGVTLDQDTFGPRYRYLSQGSTELRVDEKAGRTDRLWTTGWKPISFDRPPSEMNVIDAIFTVPLTNGRWEGERVCFDVQNKSNYIIKAIDATVKVTPKSTSDSSTSLPIVLRPQVFALLDVGDDDRFCGTAGAFPGSADWSYDVQKYTGWKK
jgi:hypothetical protein